MEAKYTYILKYEILRSYQSLEALGGVLVQGTKWCGKTTTSVHHAGSVLYMYDPEMKELNMAMAQTNIKRLLQGVTQDISWIQALLQRH